MHKKYHIVDGTKNMVQVFLILKVIQMVFMTDLGIIILLGSYRYQVLVYGRVFSLSLTTVTAKLNLTLIFRLLRSGLRIY